MRKTLCGIGIALLMQAGVGLAAETDATYLGVKAGIFLPNGKGPSGGNSNGLADFDTGYSFDLALGFKPAPYAAVELGTGFFTASADVGTTNWAQQMTGYGIPVTLTVKGLLTLDRLDMFAGAGAGYYFSFINNKIDFLGARSNVDESAHGGAVGYHVTAGADYRINDEWSAGIDFRWFSTKPELQLTNPELTLGGSQDPRPKAKWEFGGTVLNAGVKYKF